MIATRVRRHETYPVKILFLSKTGGEVWVRDFGVGLTANNMNYYTN